MAERRGLFTRRELDSLMAERNERTVFATDLSAPAGASSLRVENEPSVPKAVRFADGSIPSEDMPPQSGGPP